MSKILTFIAKSSNEWNQAEKIAVENGFKYPLLTKIRSNHVDFKERKPLMTLWLNKKLITRSSANYKLPEDQYDVLNTEKLEDFEDILESNI